MAEPHVFLVTESPPPEPGRPATGLQLRHARMAREIAAAGVPVTYAWPDPHRPEAAPPAVADGFETAPLRSRADLAARLERRRPSALVLGYWELAGWLPDELQMPLVLDHVAPRLLERQFEDRDRLGADIDGLLPVLARVAEVWVGNRRQADLMLSWMLLAGHDCRFEAPIAVVPIAGDPVRCVPDRSGAPYKAFHGGRSWPWRRSGRWIAPLAGAGLRDWRLIDGSESRTGDGNDEGGGFGTLECYYEQLAGCHILLELCDENVERRYSQSFRMTDALCAGVPVVCNRFLPLAETIAAREAGWLIDAPDELPPLLESLAANPDELSRRADNALTLARDEFDAARVYRVLAERLRRLAESGPPRAPDRPLFAGGRNARRAGMRRALRDYAARWLHHRLRLPFHAFLRRRLEKRPRPDGDRSCWIVVSRSDIFPTVHGAAVKIERTAWGLSFHVGEVLLITDRRDGYWRYVRGERSFHRFPVGLRMIGWPRIVNMLRLMARGLPYSDAFLYLPLVDRGLQARLMWLIARHPVEVVQGEFPAYARPAVWASRLFGTKALMVEHNVEFRRIAEQVPELTEAGRLLLRRHEVELAGACDRVITVSGRDRDELVAAGVPGANVRVIPHGVDLDRFDRARAIDLRDRFGIPPEHAVLVFHGIYTYPPNLDAVEELSACLLPALERAGVPATVVAFGPEPPEKKLAGVVFAGPVDDLAGHLKGGDLAVIPLRQGGGTRMKILDDFAAGVPVVTTHKGMEGIPVENGRELVIVDDPDEMARAVVDLLDHPARCAELAGRAREFVARLDWREIAWRYVELMRA
ncbi:MAG: glycosyltransferase [Wenzhouxiangellaceae bacterium]|nr:glycosyltransferase [Wenzhouxiangellaceae bacterium]